MRAYIARRIAQFIPVVLITALAVWAMTYALPGDPTSTLAGENASPEQIAAIKERLGLDQPVFTQFVTWTGNAVTGDLGQSFISGHTVTSLLVDRIPATIQLAFLALLIGLAISVPLGVAAALKPRSWIGKVINVYLAATLAAPAFWIALALVIIFAVQLQWLPSASQYIPLWENPGQALRNTILPAAAIGLNMSAITTRFIATSLAEVMERDFIRTAKAKGAPRTRVVIRHGLRNALLPTITIIGLQLGHLLGGALIIEVIFNYPGIGRLLYTAIGDRDYTLVQGGVLFIVATFLLVNLAVDLAYAYLDPRIRYH